MNSRINHVVIRYTSDLGYISQRRHILIPSYMNVEPALQRQCAYRWSGRSKCTRSFHNVSYTTTEMQILRRCTYWSRCTDSSDCLDSTLEQGHDRPSDAMKKFIGNWGWRHPGRPLLTWLTFPGNTVVRAAVRVNVAGLCQGRAPCTQWGKTRGRHVVTI